VLYRIEYMKVMVIIRIILIRMILIIEENKLGGIDYSKEKLDKLSKGYNLLC